jgi:sugar/nucleoside kinase (ribokinase family)
VQRVDVSGVAAREVDPTGAGDVFAATFVCALGEGASPVEAASWANAAGAGAVEGVSVASIAPRDTVAARRRSS